MIGCGCSAAARHVSGSSRMTSSGSLPSGSRTTPTSVRRPVWALRSISPTSAVSSVAPNVAAPCPAGVDVVGQRDARRIAGDELDLAGRQRRAQAADDVLEALLVGHQRVGVALDEHGPALLADGALGAVDEVQRAALVEQQRGRRVEVLGAAIAVGRLGRVVSLPMIRPPRPVALPDASRMGKMIAAAEAVVDAAPLRRLADAGRPPPAPSSVKPRFVDQRRASGVSQASGA